MLVGGLHLSFVLLDTQTRVPQDVFQGQTGRNKEGMTTRHTHKRQNYALILVIRRRVSQNKLQTGEAVEKAGKLHVHLQTCYRHRVPE